MVFDNIVLGLLSFSLLRIAWKDANWKRVVVAALISACPFLPSAWLVWAGALGLWWLYYKL